MPIPLKKDIVNLAEHVSDDEIFELMGVTSDGIPTLAGVLAFSKYPQAYFPQLCVTAVVVPGTELGDTGDDGERFIANQRITGSISEMLDEAVDFVRRNSRVKTIIDDDGKRKDKPEFPIKAVREAILNALIHRDYSIHTENIPVQIEMYSDRMEIANSGGLYGKISFIYSERFIRKQKILLWQIFWNCFMLQKIDIRGFLQFAPNLRMPNFPLPPFRLCTANSEYLLRILLRRYPLTESTS